MAGVQSRAAEPLARPALAQLEIARSGGRSVVTRAFAESPIRLLAPRNHGRAAWIYTSTYGGGLVDGDRLSIDVRVLPGASAFVSTQAATKVYRSHGGSRAELAARVDEGGLLILAPDPLICFRGARYRQKQRLDIAHDAALVVVDWLSAGRCASGERWAFNEFRSVLEISVAGSLLVRDSMTLEAQDGNLADRLGRFNIIGTAVLIGETLRDHARTLLDASATVRVRRGQNQVMTASPLADGGCMLRIAGTSTEAAGRAMRDALCFIPALLGDNPWQRKW